jgi:hypothetical protein
MAEHVILAGIVVVSGDIEKKNCIIVSSETS